MPGTSLASTGAAGQLRMAIDSNADLSNPSLTAQRQGYVVLNAWQTDTLQRIKDANPNVRVLVYKNLTASRADSSTGLYSTGVSYQQADNQHPEWFLKNQSGQRISFNDYPSLWAMDVGSASYDQTWANNVISELQTKGWDGVFMDDTNTTMKYHYDRSQIVKYPTDSRWQAATESALAYIGPRVQAAGKLAIANIGSWGEYPSVGRSWLQYLSGGMDEMFVKWGTTAGSGYADQARWSTQLNSLQYAQQHGKDFLAITHSAHGDAAAARYGWATVLLGAQRHANYAMASDYTSESWFPEYDYRVGDPTGPESTDANGVHRRVFTNGIVVVNPTSIQLTGNLNGTYSGSGLSRVSSVRLAPHSGYVLTGSASPTSGGASPDNSATTTTVTQTPHRRGGKLKGTVSGSSGSVKVGSASALRGGRVSLRLYRWRQGHWRHLRHTQTMPLSSGGQFQTAVPASGGRELPTGIYRVRARYLGFRSAMPSTSPFRMFRLHS
jgi:putative glycosyl hydrolase-like family 15 (GHL15) protein